MKANPKRRRRTSLQRYKTRYRRNPNLIPAGLVTQQLIPALAGAVGATANDVAMGYAARFLPALLTSPNLLRLTKGAVAVGLGMLVESTRLVRAPLVRQGVVGALTTLLHDVVRAQLQQMLPTVPLGEQFALGDGYPYYIGNGLSSVQMNVPIAGGPGISLGEQLTDQSFHGFPPDRERLLPVQELPAFYQ